MSSSSSLSSVVCHQFSLDQIKDATNNFDVSNILGVGGVATVYLGHIAIGGDDQKISVAVKLSNPNSIGFEKEIEVVSKIQHPNIVSLLGYCNELDQKILVYEYTEKGSLSDYVRKKSICLSWKQRLNICLGAALGLQYLHTATVESPKGIIHRDMKPGNILLDKNWVAKVSIDLWLLKLSHAGQTHSTMNTDLKGTSGYFAPEYIRTGQITRKIDVYAFGVVLFEMLCRKKPWDRGDDEIDYFISDDEDLGLWAMKNVDSEITGEISVASLEIFADIVGRSLRYNPDMRPTMDEVVLDLERALRCLSVVCHQFSLDQIKDATNNFDKSNILGHGGEGMVYLGHMAIGGDDQKLSVAVKLLNPNSIEFEKEIKIVSKIQHPNLVALLGYCNEFDRKILVYEYMQNGSLLDCFKKKEIICLSWKQRLNICLGVAHGLEYLHTTTVEFPKGIIHRDLKPANILLNKNWVAKVSDFGMLKLSHANQTNSIMSTTLKGTCGYYAPEYFKTRKITRKIDVYAFGVVLFEMLCQKTPWDRGDDQSYYIRDDEDLGLWAMKNVDSEITGEISDPSLEIFADIVGRSLRPNPDMRPTMDEVVLDLKRALKCQEHDDNEGIRREALRASIPSNIQKLIQKLIQDINDINPGDDEINAMLKKSSMDSIVQAAQSIELLNRPGTIGSTLGMEDVLLAKKRVQKVEMRVQMAKMSIRNIESEIRTHITSLKDKNLRMTP